MAGRWVRSSPLDGKRNGRDRNDGGDRDDGSDSDRDDDADQDDNDGVNCRVGGNSFPTGTEVLMSDGTHMAIDQIQPGDYVLAANTATGVWSSRPVLDQWSHLDDGHMATVTLTDGSTVTATDHHEFWIANDGTWRELDDVRPGDLLLTPHGVTPVAALDVSERNDTVVWELDIATDDTFTVHTGLAAIPFS